ncbi:protein FAM107B isoform X2 [Sitophilus oryzae]|uniref:Protein FAM107B isoform X2 n=1 Tax=Sitophilus oryzae TaxID=7048 RepID=A0A6J2XG06_SITOR|nr:protein FAM107B isoform X2 [Sitophilus oryzae]
MCLFCCCGCRRRKRIRNVEDGRESPDYGNNYKKDLTNVEQPFIRNNTIEELKLKLENKEILVRQRPNTPTSPVTPTTPTTPTGKDPLGDDQDDMIPETRAPPLLTDDGLIAPRKPANPVREDPGRQNLHKELLFNQKIGKNVLNQKTELQRALERHKDNLAKKQLENHIAAKVPELEKVIADRAKRLEKPDKVENEEDKVINKEFLQARMKLKATNELK